MFFITSKLFWLIAAPSSLLLLLLALGLFLSRMRFGRQLTALAASVLLVAAFSPLGELMLIPLEERFARPGADLAPPTGIIVLGGAVDEDLTRLRDQVALTEAAGRMTEAVHLALRFPHARLVFSGGTAHLRGASQTESDAARRLWGELGVAPERMSFEDQSRNTFENAAYTKDLVRPKPGETWLLVTSASHMPRAVGIFRRIGFPVVPYPVDYRTAPPGEGVPFTLAGADNLKRVDLAAREWIGLFAYWLTGRTDALFPGP